MNGGLPVVTVPPVIAADPVGNCPGQPALVSRGPEQPRFFRMGKETGFHQSSGQPGLVEDEEIARGRLLGYGLHFVQFFLDEAGKLFTGVVTGVVEGHRSPSFFIFRPVAMDTDKANSPGLSGFFDAGSQIPPVPAAFPRDKREKVRIGCSGHHNVRPAGAQVIPYAQGNGEVDLFLESSSLLAGTAVDATVPGINHHHRAGGAYEALY